MTSAMETKLTSGKTALVPADQSVIAALAYQLWQDRGCPIGSPDEDWFEAEKQAVSRSERSVIARHADGLAR